MIDLKKIVTDQNDSIEQSVSSITSTWLERARQGNGDARERLVRTYRGLVCWWAAKSGIQRQVIDDLVQEVFSAVAIAMPGYEHESFRGFLWSITRNKIQDFKGSTGDPIQLTMHCTEGGPIVSKPIVKAFQSPGDPPHHEGRLDEQVQGQAYNGTIDDPYDETIFLQVTARFKGEKIVTREYSNDDWSQ